MNIQQNSPHREIVLNLVNFVCTIQRKFLKFLLYNIFVFIFQIFKKKYFVGNRPRESGRISEI